MNNEWQYRYSPLGEREQKRLYKSVAGTQFNSTHPWAYYLLGGNNEQLAVYHGIESSDIFVPLLNGTLNPNGYSSVFIYPVEFNLYAGKTNPITWVYDSTGWLPEYKLADHIGSIRIIARDTGITTTKDYEPFGEERSNDFARTGFIGKEKDNENNLSDFGVRKYDEGLGRFLSVDKLWSEQLTWNPFHYSYNNPVSFSDGSGLWAREVTNSADNQYWNNQYYLGSNNTQRSEGYLENLVNNTMYNMFKTSAPSIAKFIENTNFNVTVDNSINGEGTFGLQSFLISIKTLDRKEAQIISTTLHEIVHRMGYKEFGSFAAEYAAGYLTNEEVISYLYDPSKIPNSNMSFSEYFKQGMPENFKNYFNGVGGLKSEENFFKEFLEYGNKIIGK